MKHHKIDPKILLRLRDAVSLHGSLEMHKDLEKVMRRLDALEKTVNSSEDRLQDLEIQVNLLTRLLTTLCIEKFKIRIGVLKRIIKRIEEEAVRESQIMHLESIYNMHEEQDKKDPPQAPPSKNDPWEEIS